MILGIDIGGTTVKCGIVSHEGEISEVRVFSTPGWVESKGFVESLKIEIGNYLKDFPSIKGVGMGFPGLLSPDRKKVVLLANIPSVVNAPVIELLNSTYPGIVFRMENDAKCAALGEHYFGENKGIDNYMMITLGTGVGGGIIIDKKLFIGARGNAAEIGHVLVSNGKTLEKNIGINHLIKIAVEKLKNYEGKSLLKGKDITPKVISECAAQGDELSKEIWKSVGYYLGEALVGVIRLFDLNTFLIGGGISGAFDHFVPEMTRVIKENLPSYYTDDLTIKKAKLGNDAGLLGAAGLIIENFNLEREL
ncbi:MAG: ROK family protein [Cytophagaceae bacterium]|nr:ROK family protein [Cytophagaceae bacterium]MDW8456546.1 ROK family protein [Cytophagaceae bacterium]